MPTVVHLCHHRGRRHLRATGYCGEHQQPTTAHCGDCGIETDRKHRCH